MEQGSDDAITRPLRVLLVGPSQETAVVRSLLRGGAIVPGAVTRLVSMTPLLLTQPDVVIAYSYQPDEVRSLRRLIADLPLLISASNAQEAQVVQILDAGADDYIRLPCGRDEVQARIRRHVCRFRETARSSSYAPEHPWPISLLESEDQQIRLYVHERTVMVRGQAIHLSATECALLLLLMRAGGMVVHGTFLLQAVWGEGYHRELDYIRVYMRQLRRKVEIDPDHPCAIETVPGVGYRFRQSCRCLHEANLFSGSHVIR